MSIRKRTQYKRRYAHPSEHCLPLRLLCVYDILLWANAVPNHLLYKYTFYVQTTKPLCSCTYIHTRDFYTHSPRTRTQLTHSFPIDTFSSRILPSYLRHLLSHSIIPSLPSVYAEVHTTNAYFDMYIYSTSNGATVTSPNDCYFQRC